MRLQKKTILIVEDERPLYSIIKSKFEMEGFGIITAKSVDQALSRLKNGVKIDAIWLDHYLFGKRNGLEFVAKIKQAGSAWKSLPIFVVSNTVSLQKIKVYLKLGVVKCYTKVDFRLDQIVKDIKKYLESKKV